MGSLVSSVSISYEKNEIPGTRVFAIAADKQLHTYKEVQRLSLEQQRQKVPFLNLKKYLVSHNKRPKPARTYLCRIYAESHIWNHPTIKSTTPRWTLWCFHYSSVTKRQQFSCPLGTATPSLKFEDVVLGRWICYLWTAARPTMMGKFEP